MTSHNICKLSSFGVGVSGEQPIICVDRGCMTTEVLSHLSANGTPFVGMAPKSILYHAWRCLEYNASAATPAGSSMSVCIFSRRFQCTVILFLDRKMRSNKELTAVRLLCRLPMLTTKQLVSCDRSTVKACSFPLF